MGSAQGQFPAWGLLATEAQEKICPQPPARPHILRVVELRTSEVVVLEGSDAARVQRQVKDKAHSPLPILDPSLHPDRFYKGPTGESADAKIAQAR